MTFKPVIIWERWVDPYGENIDELAWPLAEEKQTEEYKDSMQVQEEAMWSNDAPTFKGEKPMKLIATPMGVIPIMEHSLPSRVFKFCVGHTNFNLTQDMGNIINEIDGVETLDVFTRYRFRIAVGKAFDSNEVRNNINQAVKEYFANV